MHIAVTHYGMSLPTGNNTGHIISPRKVINQGKGAQIKVTILTTLSIT